MPVLDGRIESCSAKTNSSNYSPLENKAVTIIRHCSALSVQVLDGRRES